MVVPAPIGTPPVTTVEPFALPIVIGVKNDVGDLLGDLSTDATDCDKYDEQPARIDAESNEADGSLRLAGRSAQRLCRRAGEGATRGA